MLYYAYFASSALLPTGLYIFACVNFFLTSFLMTYRRQIISGSTGPIFAIFSPKQNVLGADVRSGPLFPISQGTLPWHQFCEKMANSPLSTLWDSETEWDIATQQRK